MSAWREWVDRVWPPDGWRPMPVARGSHQAADMTGTRRDGTTYSLRASLGLPAADAADSDSGVRWSPWP